MRDIKVSYVLVSLAALVLLSGCTVRTHEQTSKEGEKVKEDVDIRTPLGSLSVHTGSNDAKDTGLALYPGATISQERGIDHEGDSNANVNINSSLFGFKLVVLKYRSSDPPEKVLGFYRKEMERYGKVVDCNGAVSMNFHRSGTDKPVTCDNHGSSHDNYKQELKVGTENNQRVVAIKPSGAGSEFVLVYVRAHGENQDTL
jgi:hypothetical protein